MWPNFFTGFPFLFPTIGRANFNTLPTVVVTVGTENVTLELPNHAFRNRSYVGGFYAGISHGRSASTRMEKKRSTLADMWDRRCSR